MNKTDLVNYMKASREILRYDRESASWKRAFQLIREAGYENLDMDCSKCITKVTEWLQK